MATLEELEEKIALLEHQLESALDEKVGRLEDIKAIENLQYAYGYYIDMLLYDEMADLF